jgi:hypothetical protein
MDSGVAADRWRKPVSRDELGHADGLRLLLRHGADPKDANALYALNFDNAEMVGLLLDGNTN